MQANAQHSDDALEQIEESCVVLSEIKVSIGEINDINQKIAVATQQQMKSSESLNSKVSQISEKSQENFSLSNETRTHAQSLDLISSQLQKLIGSFKL